MPKKSDKSRVRDDNLIKLVHTDDLHLGSPLASISVREDQIASQLARSTFQGFENIVDLCIQEKVDFLLISGDIYDGADRGVYEQLTFRKYLQRLSESGIRVYLAFGNHDPLEGWAAHINWPKNVHVMRGDEPERALFRGSNGREVAIVGISYQTGETYENLATRFPQKKADWPFTIGMLHCTLDAGAGHEPYSPCSLKDLIQPGYDYWALGHIHKPTVIQRSRPAIVYSGNPQGRDIGERGPRGCYLVSVDEEHNVDAQFVETASIRWEDVEISIDGAETENDLLERIGDTQSHLREKSGGRGVLYRLKLTGRGGVHARLIREGTIPQILQWFRDNERGKEDFVLLERIIDRTEPPIDREQVAKRADIVGDIIQITDDILESDEALLALRPVLADLFESPKGQEYITELNLDELRELVRGAETYLLDQFVGDDPQ